MSQTPTVSILIATYNRREALGATMPSVLGQDFPHDRYEVVVVVDGSSDGTVEYLQSLGDGRLRIVEQPNRGQFRALNRALEAARGEIVLFLDDDIVCEPGLLREHVSAHEGADSLLVFGPILLDPKSPPGLVTDWVAAYTRGWIAQAGRGSARDRRRGSAYTPTPRSAVRRSFSAAASTKASSARWPTSSSG